MGPVSKDSEVKRVTELKAVFNIVKECIKSIRPDFTVEQFIFLFFSRFVPVNHLNHNLNSINGPNHQKCLLRLCFLKAILPLNILRSLCLFPPEGVDLDLWVCCVSPCSSSDRLKYQNIEAIGYIRECLRLDDRLPEGYYKTFEQSWSNLERGKPINKTKTLNFGKCPPVMLFPIKNLPLRSRASIFQYQRDPVTFESVADHLFLCPDHFTAKENRILELSLRSDLIFNYSLEYIFEVLNSGNAEIKLGRKSWRNQPCLPYLISRAKTEPPFAALTTVSESDKSNLRMILDRMAQAGIFSTEMDQIYGSNLRFNSDFTG